VASLRLAVAVEESVQINNPLFLPNEVSAGNHGKKSVEVLIREKCPGSTRIKPRSF
jgi:hypothetical protein